MSYVEERNAVRPLVHAGRTIGVPGSVERHFRRFKAPLQIVLGRWTARAADLVLAPSAATAAELVRDYGARDPRVLPNVTSEFPAELSGTADSSGFPFNEPLSSGAEGGELLFVGRLRIRKGVEVLLEALAALGSTHPEARLIVAGDGEHRAALEAKARELRLGERVRFSGRVPAAVVRSLLARASALVVPSTYEGMPLVVLEAMAAGLPVVASRVSGIPEVVVDGETGWLVAPEDPQALASALDALLADRAEGARRGIAGAARVEACYRPRHAAALWESIVVADLQGSREWSR